MSKTKKMGKVVLSAKLGEASGDQALLALWSSLCDACLSGVFPVELKLALAFVLIRATIREHPFWTETTVSR